MKATAFLFARFWSPTAISTLQPTRVMGATRVGLFRHFADERQEAAPTSMLESTKDMLGLDKKGNQRAIFLYDGKFKSWSAQDL